MNENSHFGSPVSDNPATLGERLRWLRKQRGLTQVELAAAMGCEQAMISSWEVGRTQPTAATQMALARFHQISPAVLDSGENFMEVAAQAIENLRAEGRTRHEPGAAVEMRLEAPPFGKAVLLDLVTGAESHADLNEAMIQFLRAAQKGREIWVAMR